MSAKQVFPGTQTDSLSQQLTFIRRIVALLLHPLQQQREHTRDGLHLLVAVCLVKLAQVDPKVRRRLVGVVRLE